MNWFNRRKNNTSCSTHTTKPENAVLFLLVYNMIVDRLLWHGGWIDTGKRKIICHYFYCKEHIDPLYTLKWHQRDLVVENYEGLTADEKAKIQDTSYKNAKAYLLLTNSNNNETTSKKKPKSKKKCWGIF